MRIVAVTGKKSGVVFDWVNDKNNSEKKPPRQEESASPAPASEKRESKTDGKITVDQAMNYVLQSGKFAGMKLSECSEGYLKYCSEKCTGKMKELVDIVLRELERKDKE